jgi:hypothetical protein
MNIETDNESIAGGDVCPASPVPTGRGKRQRAQLTGAAYGRLVEVCDAFHIPRTKAFAYAKAGLVTTFLLDRQRMVDVDSVKTLPTRLGLIKETGDGN